MDNPVKDNLKQLMISDSKISEGELSRRSGIPQSTIHRILSGQIKESKPSTLRPLANYFGLSLAQLQGEEPMPIQRQSNIHENTDAKQYLGNPARLIPHYNLGASSTMERASQNLPT
jgi:transcriptional regulator with XRE-family HTH domain